MGLDVLQVELKRQDNVIRGKWMSDAKLSIPISHVISQVITYNEHHATNNYHGTWQWPIVHRMLSEWFTNI